MVLFSISIRSVEILIYSFKFAANNCCDSQCVANMPLETSQNLIWQYFENIIWILNIEMFDIVNGGIQCWRWVVCNDVIYLHSPYYEIILSQSHIQLRLKKTLSASIWVLHVYYTMHIGCVEFEVIPLTYSYYTNMYFQSVYI